MPQSSARELLLRRLLLERELLRRAQRRRFYTYFPDEGPLRRDLYRKHMAFFALGARHKTRCFMAANRVGKTEGGGGYEMVCHLTGIYPRWWRGARFDHPIDAWAAGDTGETVRDIIQSKLFGKVREEGTGLIPGDLIGHVSRRPNTNGAIDTAKIKHASGGWSLLGLKSYEQGRKAFQGTEKHLIWLDEESPPQIRGECVMRLMTTGGHLIETYTPLSGLTENVLRYIGDKGDDMVEAGVIELDDRAMVNAGWDDVPHLSDAERERMLAESEPHLRDARSRGIPSMGAGAIYPIPEADILVDDFEIPAHWPRLYALDVGWNKTAAVWGAINREGDHPTLYLYAEHYRGQAEPVVHADAIKGRGAWIRGAIDPAARGRSQEDGKRLIEIYKGLGLLLQEANNEVEAGIYDVWTALSTGRIKVFKSLSNWRFEYRMYRRDENGKIVKKNDHLMDCTRYLRRSLHLARVAPAPQRYAEPSFQPFDRAMGY